MVIINEAASDKIKHLKSPHYISDDAHKRATHLIQEISAIIAHELHDHTKSFGKIPPWDLKVYRLGSKRPTPKSNDKQHLKDLDADIKHIESAFINKYYRDSANPITDNKPLEKQITTDRKQFLDGLIVTFNEVPAPHHQKERFPPQLLAQLATMIKREVLHEVGDFITNLHIEQTVIDGERVTGENYYSEGKNKYIMSPYKTVVIIAGFNWNGGNSQIENIKKMQSFKLVKDVDSNSAGYKKPQGYTSNINEIVKILDTFPIHVRQELIDRIDDFLK